MLISPLYCWQRCECRWLLRRRPHLEEIRLTSATPGTKKNKLAAACMHAETDEDVLIYVGVRREDSERHITSVISHSCGGRGPDGTLRDLCRGIVVFSAPVIQIIRTEPLPLSVPLLLSAPIRAIFFSSRNCTHPSASGTVSVRGRAWLQVFTSPSDVLSPVMHSTAARRVLKKVCTLFFFFLIGPQE